MWACHLGIVRVLLLVCLLEQACCERPRRGARPSVVEVSSEAVLHRHKHQSHHRLPRLTHALVNVSTDRGRSKDPLGVSGVEHESWGDRMKAAVGDCIMGIIMLIFSIPILWTGESRNAKMETLIARAKEQAREVDAKVAKPENDNWLVHVPESRLHAADSVQDARFDVLLKEGCVRLMSEVEVYQVIETKTTTEKETLGGGKEKTTHYTYSEKWSSSYDDSQGYYDVHKRVNWKPEGLQAGAQTEDCKRVELGDAYLLSQALVQECSNFKPIGDLLKQEAVTTIVGSLKFMGEKGGFFYLRRQADVQGDTEEERHGPKIGDCRVCFKYVPDDFDVTVFALQVQTAGEERRTFLPYRLVDRGFCCFTLSEEGEKLALRTEGEKDASRLAQEAGCPGPLACICCAFNLVMKCFASMLVAEIHHLWTGRLDMQTCLDQLEFQSAIKKWVIRIGGWLMMFSGLYNLFKPLLIFITVIPFVGPFLADFGGTVIWILSFVLTITISYLIVGIAYLFYHPMKGLIFLAYALAPIVLIMGLARVIPH